MVRNTAVTATVRVNHAGQSKQFGTSRSRKSTFYLHLSAINLIWPKVTYFEDVNGAVIPFEEDDKKIVVTDGETIVACLPPFGRVYRIYHAV